MEPTKEVKIQIIQNEIQQFQNGLYMFSVRYRVAKQIDDKAAMESIQKEMERQQQAIDELEKVLEEVTKQE